MRLRCVSPYSNSTVRYEPGQLIDVGDAAGELLQRDSPGSFELVEQDPPARKKNAVKDAPDRMQRGGETR